MAEARRLIVHGPYALVRHPLYVCEEIAVIGIFIQVISPVALIVLIAHGVFQIRRMLHEERVLNDAFPEYENYAQRTPRLIPWPGAANRRPFILFNLKSLSAIWPNRRFRSFQ
jgi:protein-S-isoprenylcysteine O-methyltransferase Ste14